MFDVTLDTDPEIAEPSVVDQTVEITRNKMKFLVVVLVFRCSGRRCLLWRVTVAGTEAGMEGTVEDTEEDTVEDTADMEDTVTEDTVDTEVTEDTDMEDMVDTKPPLPQVRFCEFPDDETYKLYYIP